MERNEKELGKVMIGEKNEGARKGRKANKMWRMRVRRTLESGYF